ncbi:hypothetical protein KR093_004501 [Drosophila rubida]|uniref:Uncharacterized protein n=1 Tax=Drosophila rubida TaxID=30044 RepID=A0AAD4KD58_9MUSC|nr:hypothetical protein KR093_004501 [Drosophila rubida]
MAEESAPDSKSKLQLLQNLWRRFLVVEIVFFLYVVPSYFHQMALRNFPLEQACRANLGYNAATCIAILDKDVYGIDCEPLEVQLQNVTTQGATVEELSVAELSGSFNFTVCKAYAETKKIVGGVHRRCDTLVFLFPLIILLFAGGWADRYHKCKVVMILPLVGECLYYVSLLIAAVGFERLPFEYGGYLETIVPAMFGGEACLIMSIFTYMTTTTQEKQRVLRLGIFAMFCQAQLYPFVVFGAPSNVLGYKVSFATGALLQLAAIGYVIVFVKECKPHESVAELQQPSTHEDSWTDINLQLKPELESTQVELPRRNVLREFFDPSLVVELAKMPFKRRANNGRLIVLLLMLSYILTFGAEDGESRYMDLYSEEKPVWNKNFDNRLYLAVKHASAMLGTFIGTVIFSKLLKFTDPMLGIWSAVFTLVSRLIFAFAADTSSYYAAGVSDLFSLFRFIPIKTIAASVIDGEAKLFSLLGIFEPIEAQAFSALYKAVYAATSKTFAGAVFLLSELLYLPIVLIFM